MQQPSELSRIATALEQIAQHLSMTLQSGVAAPDWTASVAFRYRRLQGLGAGRGVLEAVPNVAGMAIDALKEIDVQKEKLLRNTEQFVKGLPANNVLLSGARGTGKSSLIRACLHHFSAQGLRLIEVDKTDLTDLPDILTCIAGRPEKFVIFSDDLSFEAGDGGYKALKSVLDGSVAASGANVLVYATSNRRHLLPEFMSENSAYTHTEDGEVHPGEATEEKISLSERFGLWLSFYPFSQDEYLAVVYQWLTAAGFNEAQREAARPAALLWSLERASRSGRVAQQFARDYAGQHGKTLPV